MVSIYTAAAQRNFDEAEALAKRAAELVDAGKALLDRAAKVALECSREE